MAAVKRQVAILLGVGALVLGLCGPAFAQGDPAGARADDPSDPAPEPEPATIELKLKGVKNGKVVVGRRVTVIGTIRPFVKGQRVRVWIQRGGKTIAARKTFVKQVRDRNVGRFTLRTGQLIKPGKFRAFVNKPATNNQVGARKRTGAFRIRYPDLDPGDKSNAVKLLNKLLAKQAYYTSHGRKYNSATARAVLAFRKVNNMPRTMDATPGIFKKLANGKGGFKLRYPKAGKHIEADLSRQVMVLAKGGKPRHIFHISSGAPATPTILGKYRAYRKTPGVNSLGMIDSVYFHRGYATHGYKSVPTYPASHGCLRTPPANARFIYNWINIGDPFYIYP
jgi:Uncharacterized protein conserved in bacteria